MQIWLTDARADGHMIKGVFVWAQGSYAIRACCSLQSSCFTWARACETFAMVSAVCPIDAVSRMGPADSVSRRAESARSDCSRERADSSRAEDVEERGSWEWFGDWGIQCDLTKAYKNLRLWSHVRLSPCIGRVMQGVVLRLCYDHLMVRL